MFSFYADGTWVFYPFQQLIALELLTFLIELVIAVTMNKVVMEPERQWTFLEIFAFVFAMNLASFLILIPLGIMWI